MSFKKKITSILIFLGFFINCSIYCSDLPISFYGIISEDADENMLNVTEDVFFKKIKELNSNSIDLRLLKDELITYFSENQNTKDLEKFLSINNKKSIIFAQIFKKDSDSGKWTCRIYLKNQNETLKTFEKDYDSYYKILMESSELLKEAFSSKQNEFPDSKNVNPTKKIQKPNILTTETISGTWHGEEYINKIVIMRGGRGFIIFKNGASMNISVEIVNNSEIHIKQTSSSNASYFPELPRITALEIATIAKPIEWILTFQDDGSLYGKKYTVSVNADNSVQESIFDVRWTKKELF